jgi:hypothetical protein
MQYQQLANGDDTQTKKKKIKLPLDNAILNILLSFLEKTRGSRMH